MTTAHDPETRQPIPVIAPPANDAEDLAVAAIANQLEAALVARALTHQQLSFLPNAERFAIVDGVVRMWATLRGAKIIERERHGIGPDGTGVEVYVVQLGDDDLVTVHVPDEIQRERDEAARRRRIEELRARMAADRAETDDSLDVSQMWRPAP